MIRPSYSCGMAAAICMPILHACLLNTASALAAIDLRAVALTGTDGPLGPGQGTGVIFENFSDPVLGQTGSVGFMGVLGGTGVDTSNNTGAWIDKAGSLTVQARRGTDGPLGPGLGPGIVFGNITPPIINSSDTVALWTYLHGPGIDSTNDAALWTRTNGNLSLVAREGGTGPGPALGPGIDFIDLNYDPAFNSSGQMAFKSSIAGPAVNGTNNAGIWANTSGSLAAVARTGTTGPLGPGISQDVSFKWFHAPLINDQGDVAFRASLQGAGVDDTNDWGVWTHTNNTLNLVARTGPTGPGPDLPTGTYLRHINVPSFNTNGDVAFDGFLEGQGITSDNDMGIWVGGPGTLSAVAREGTDGTLGPGMGPGVTFEALGNPSINKNGHVAHFGRIQGDGFNKFNDSGIWTNVGGRPAPVVLEGTDGPMGPGLGPGIEFTDIDVPVFNNNGDVAFVAEVNNNYPYNVGLWATNNGELVNIIEPGTLIDYDPTDGVSLRGIQDIRLSIEFGVDTGRPISFNDNGQLVFQLVFTEPILGGLKESGIYTAFAPEPSSIVLLTMIGAFTSRRNG